MSTSDLAWGVHRFLLERAGWQRPFTSGRKRKRLLLVTEADSICLAQVYPFWYHRDDLLDRYGIELREWPLKRFLAGDKRFDDADVVAFQTWFDLTPQALLDLVARLKTAYPSATLAYLDWFAPTDLRHAQTLDPHVAAYVKKQVFRDFSRYGEPTLGDTNLTDYYARRFALSEYTETRFPVPASFRQKLWLSPHFAFAPRIVDRFLKELPDATRDIDLHARIAIKGTPWYERMRREAYDAAAALSDRYSVRFEGRVSPKEYLNELCHSKLCFSPFGYGEVCWRDFEAMATGALVLKPDMSHLSCYPEAYVPFETYVPLSWDLSDLEEKVAYYLTHESARRQIVEAAFQRMRSYFIEQRFVSDLAGLLRQLKLT